MGITHGAAGLRSDYGAGCLDLGTSRGPVTKTYAGEGVAALGEAGLGGSCGS